MTLTDETWFPSLETDQPDTEVMALRRELFVKRRKEIRQTPGVWHRFHVFATRSEAARFCAEVNRGRHPVIRATVGRFEAEHLFNLAYLIWRSNK